MNHGIKERVARHSDEARQRLTGSRIILDLLVAEHFGRTQARHLAEMGNNHLDLANLERFDAWLDVARANSGGTGVPPVLSKDRRDACPTSPSQSTKEATRMTKEKQEVRRTGVPPVQGEKTTRRHLPHW
jgi:hypothetical protein